MQASELVLFFVVANSLITLGLLFSAWSLDEYVRFLYLDRQESRGRAARERLEEIYAEEGI